LGFYRITFRVAARQEHPMPSQYSRIVSAQ
jgi:hypothetical protein